jgi:hypothetical protein
VSVTDVNDSCRITLSISGTTHAGVYLTGMLQPSDDFARRALDTLILTDISTAQRFSNTRGKLTRIDLLLPDGFDAPALSAALPAGALLVNSELRNGQVIQMTNAFQVNLTALSLLALVVGIFLIYNAMTFSVVQRRALFGTLRSIGLPGNRYSAWCWVKPRWWVHWVLAWAWGWESCSDRVRYRWSHRPSTISFLSSMCAAFKSRPPACSKVDWRVCWPAYWLPAPRPGKQLPFPRGWRFAGGPGRQKPVGQ